ncbi:MAG TPA: DsbA family protein [Actinomycetota bacterium]|nr:DsbA family protein [Actinomycetota bacterium]
MATEIVRFYFDPTCPWAWQTAKWIREAESVRDLRVEWRLFSLRLVNESIDDPLTDDSAKSVPALRALALAGREGGRDAVDRLYRAIGSRIHDGDQTLSRETLDAAVADAKLPADLVRRAMADPSTADDVRAEHREAADAVEAFGVPTIVLDSGRGIFGPVVAVAPTGEAAGELWDRVRWLADLDGFFELKRDRDRRPGETVRGS